MKSLLDKLPRYIKENNTLYFLSIGVWDDTDWIVGYENPQEHKVLKHIQTDDVEKGLKQLIKRHNNKYLPNKN